MDLQGLNIRRLRFNFVLFPCLIFYAGKQAMTLICNIPATWKSQNPKDGHCVDINMYIASAASADILIRLTG